MAEQIRIVGPGSDDELLGLAAAYALDAVDDAERRAIDSAMDAAHQGVRDEFLRRVRGHREALADFARSTEEQPPESLLGGILARIDADGDMAGPAGRAAPGHVPPAPVSLDEQRLRRRWRWTRGVGAAAAAAVLVAGGVVIGNRIGGTEGPPAAAQVFDASDVRTGAVDVGGGTATVVYSRDANAAVLLMDGVAPPQPNTVYQLWLLGSDHPPTSVGMMEPAEVTPSTRAVVEDIDASTRIGISVEPPGGSPQPTNVLATISLA
ncbi:anti-sigma factor [Tomitella cavernea]|uniref:Regulator of SigK n=1 Tax=Tomitella cavernea TaxID=1387982 RepID=A0ABP9D021_9ACTN|nr:anti-sigma factor [Tomitella cavernea]